MDTLKSNCPYANVATVVVVVVFASAIAAATGSVSAAESPTPSRTAQAALNSPAMTAMLRADRDKDGMLSREELDDYDLALGKRFSEADWDRNGKLSLYEFESLFLAPEATNVGATR